MKALLAANAIELHLMQNIFFIDPQSQADADAPPSVADRMISGVVTLKLARQTFVRKLHVQFMGKVNLSEGALYTDTTIKECTHTFDLFKELNAGDHSFTVDFILPQTLAVSERSSAGRIVYTVTATAPGIGRLGSDCSASKRLLIVACHGQPGPYDNDIQNFSPDLGPYRIQVRSELLSVGGVLRYSLHLPEPPVGTKIIKTDGYFHQETTITLPDGQVIEKPTQRRRVFLVDAIHNRIDTASAVPQRMPDIHEPKTIPLPTEPLACLSGDSWTLSHFGRIPGDDLLRPSTLPGTDTPIRFSHSLVIEVSYVTAEGRERRMTINTAVDLLSCCCRYASVILPSYEERPRLEHAAKAAGLQLDAHGFAPCACGLTVLELVSEINNTALLRVPSFDLLPSPLSTEPDPRTGPKVGEISSSTELSTIASSSTSYSTSPPGRTLWDESARQLAMHA